MHRDLAKVINAEHTHGAINQLVGEVGVAGAHCWIGCGLAEMEVVGVVYIVRAD